MPQMHLCSVRALVPLGEGEKRGFFSLLLEGCGLPDWTPGQFVMLRPESWSRELPWARPFSIGRWDGNGLEIFFQVVGRGTSLLAGLRPGESVRIFGPLGQGFAREENKPVLLLAGGMGIAPFAGYIPRRAGAPNLRLCFGHRAPLACYPYAALAGNCLSEHFPDERPGDLPSFLRRMEELLAGNAREEGLVLACGPVPFLRAVRDLSLKHGARTQISLENRMACGLGVCLGCVVKPLMDDKGRNRSRQPVPPALEQGLPVPVCSCGPVFWADAVELDA
ncbi:MAG: dihydroorotate dehydrogenase electron transfer subunit [Deltaproteobacteria bacterium]|jgi:dihydroorotate dehydrogenase electron transfer subunit|nr:dihydroorotate dehydrogenase electron transfer subunit [Deltaproteobacteria bacterium]